MESLLEAMDFHFQAKLLKLPLSMIQAAADSQSLCLATITLLKKKDKDPLLCGSFRPRLETVVQKCIRIYARKLTSDNIRIFYVIYHTHSLNTPNVVVSVDAEKAFYTVEWISLLAVLEIFNFGQRNKTRQLLSFVFALAVEPLASIISSLNVIQGIYIDNILFYLSNPEQYLFSLLELLVAFGSVSGFKVNWGKTEIVPISNFDSNPLERRYKWKWSHSHLKTLRVLLK
ncbi:unnamed protein product [Coregonus sp. 'balchen']|nr:unnamed protein product [Coregonus sp. 'balchen']